MKVEWTDLSLFKRYLEEKPNLMPLSIKTYVDSVSRFISQNPDITNLNSYNDFIIKYAIKKSCSHYYSALKHYINFKIDDTKLRAYLLEGMQQPPEKHNRIRERVHMSKKEREKVIGHMKEYKNKIVAFILDLTGVRVSEVLALKEGDIVTEEYKGKEVTKMIMTGKRGRKKIVYIHPPWKQSVIWSYLTTSDGFSDYYFLRLGKMRNRHGNTGDITKLIRMNYHWFWEDLKQATSILGYRPEDFAAHDFRRCFARDLWEKDKDLYKLQNALHHADPKTTLRYLDQSGLRNIDTFKEMQEK